MLQLVGLERFRLKMRSSSDDNVESTTDGRYRVGDPVIYRRPKFSVSPGPRARHIDAAPHGDRYSYIVDKFWVVEGITPEGRLVARTRRGKRHEIDPTDPNLRHPTWWERLRWGAKFPEVGSSDSSFNPGRDVGHQPPMAS